MYNDVNQNIENEMMWCVYTGYFHSNGFELKRPTDSHSKTNSDVSLWPTEHNFLYSVNSNKKKTTFTAVKSRRFSLNYGMWVEDKCQDSRICFL